MLEIEKISTKMPGIAINQDNTELKPNKCSICGKTVEKIYQRTNCKSCLLKSFKNIFPLMNAYRNGNYSTKPE